MSNRILNPPPSAAFAGWRPPDLLPFHWHVYDVGAVLPPGWDAELLRLAGTQAVHRQFRPTMVATAREAPGAELTLQTVDGEVLHEQAAWLYQLYTGWFRQLAQRLVDEPLQLTSTHNRALSLNIMRAGDGRYPCHVDSNPMQGLLYLSDCDQQTGGGLAVARDTAARDLAAVDADCTVLYPRRGQLYFFDARAHAHYVRPLVGTGGLRAVVTMNYYSPSCPEAVRPAGLDEQLFGSRPAGPAPA